MAKISWDRPKERMRRLVDIPSERDASREETSAFNVLQVQKEQHTVAELLRHELLQPGSVYPKEVREPMVGWLRSVQEWQQANKGRLLAADFASKLARYEKAMDIAVSVLARGEDIKLREHRLRRARVVKEKFSPDWAKDPSTLPKRPPGQ